MSGPPPADHGPHRLARTFTAEWLAAQRWFRRKSRRVASVELYDATPLDRGRGWLVILSATDDAGTEDRYLVPAVAAADGFREPRGGEGIWQRLAGLMAAGGELRAEHGRFVFSPSSALGGFLPGGAASLAALAERRLGVEQSNTSVVLGERLILKCYRLLEAGSNPEIEVNSFLAEVGFSGVPTLGGHAEYIPDRGTPCAVAMLQELVVTRANGWEWVQDRLAGGSREKARATAAIARLGTLTRALHVALASRPEVPGFPSRTATPQELAVWHARAHAQLEGALASVADAPRTRLLAVAPRLRTRLFAILEAGPTRVARVHGDYHLGQLLRTSRGFKIIDFEGEPARPLAERREPASPLRDVAGMLRSIDYAAQVAHRERGLREPDSWARAAADEFLSSYGAISATDARLLEAFVIDKACYEVRYEADNRPGWEWIPLGALERMADQPED